MKRRIVIEFLLEMMRLVIHIIIFYVFLRHRIPYVKYENEISLFFACLLALVLWGILDPIKLSKNK